MQKKETWLTGFMSSFFMIFTLEIIFVSLMGVFQGVDAGDYSTLYSLGNQGMSYATMFQLSLNAVVITGLVKLFFYEKFFGNMMIIWRTVLLLIAIIFVIIVFIIVFDWFPIDFIPGWIGFFASFGICFAASTSLMLIKTKLESRKYEELLEHYKQNVNTEDTDNDEK